MDARRAEDGGVLDKGREAADAFRGGRVSEERPLPPDWEARDGLGCYELAVAEAKKGFCAGRPEWDFFSRKPFAFERLRVLAEAKEWLGTPYHHMGRVKGVAVDCLTLLAEVYEKAGVTPFVEIPFYPPDWYLHREEERYLQGLLPYAREIEAPPLPGDIALFRFGRCFAHGAIVTAWPQLIHAFVHHGVTRFSAESGLLSGRPARFFSPFVGDGGGMTEDGTGSLPAGK